MYLSCASRILVGLGSNLTGPWGSPTDTLARALQCFPRFGIKVLETSSILSTEPFGSKNQPIFANAVAVVETHLSPGSLLGVLHRIEALAGRERARRWGARTLDLDLLAYHSIVTSRPSQQQWRRGRRHPLVLPHPELSLRPFVVEPISEIAPFWHHPVSGLTALQLSRRLKQARGGRVLRQS